MRHGYLTPNICTMNNIEGQQDDGVFANDECLHMLHVCLTHVLYENIHSTLLE